ncbi:D-2-hydroxyacid dehydrogenase family protein [Streptacidiphilus sp. P02-A3a]|uniref:D-2-hydroxyacid dehydrogenase family protein n=1 Tax=Streptacidiphilus sp. P02-A3a TaxID=2704468 RepID=UPI0015FC33D9|nr:D-2-hydroxyacid dehydrogenase family protein [Streptacidiphilus sp. P02-A3a]QMU74271.1 D-2-hydroxyacid dehydrogenase family protein [Streptacidiphilus sp. P02-A3a]
MKLRCAVLDDYQGVAQATGDWSRLAGSVAVTSLREHLGDQNELVAAIGDCEIVVAMRERTPFTAELFARLPRLRLLITSGMRNASIDLAAAAEHGVTVCGTASASEPPIELTWALILGLTKHLLPESTALRTGGPWQSTIGTDLHGARLGLLGLGKIGGAVARIGRAFGMEVAAWSQNLTAERAAAQGVRLAPSKEQLLAESDVVSVHLVLSERTRGLIGAAELKQMRPSAYLVNTSRAAIVDQAALASALREGWIAGAGVDVFATEPLPADDEFRSLPNLLATPHIGYVTERNYRIYFEQAVEDIEAFIAGAPLRQLG